MLVNGRPRIHDEVVKTSQITALQEIAHDGVLSAELTIFGFATQARKTVNNLYKVITKVETSLTSDRAIREIVNYPISLRFQYYTAFTKIVMKIIDYMEKIHILAADQAKFNIIKERLTELQNPSLGKKEKQDIVIEGKKAVDGVLLALEHEMKKRSTRR